MKDDIQISKNDFVVFDLDDTIYKELRFLESAYRHIASLLRHEIGVNVYQEMLDWYKEKEITFDKLFTKYDFSLSMEKIVSEYRYHIPDINLESKTKDVFNLLKVEDVKIGLITDGRSKTQRNKLKALGIDSIFELIIISEEFGSEKPNTNNFKTFENKFQEYNFTYIGDNYKKDFVAPNKLGWRTIGLLDNGENIHKQNGEYSKEQLPDVEINCLSKIIGGFQ